VKLSFFIAVCLALTGCCSKQRDYVLLLDNSMLIHINYNDSAVFEFPFASFEHNPVISMSSFDVKKQKIRIPFTGKDSILIREILDNFRSNYFKNEYSYYSNDSTSQIGVFFCGKLSIVDSISSYLVLTERQDDRYNLFTGNYFRDLYLLNYKNNRLTSIAELSSDMLSDDSRTMVVTYLMGEKIPFWHFFSQVDFGGFLDFSIGAFLTEQAIQDLSDYVKMKEGTITIRSTVFAIDVNGFIIFI